MSFINKILDRVKKRGAKAPSGEPASQTAHVPKNRIKTALTALIGVIVLGSAGAAGWFWWSSQQKAAIPLKAAQVPIKPISPPQGVPPPVAVPNVASGVGSSQPVAASQPAETVTREAAPKESEPKEREHETEAATLSPAPELDVLPPAKAHNKYPVSTSKPKHNKAAPMHAPDTKDAEPEDEPVAPPVAEGSVDKKVKPLSLQQQADNEYRKANGLVQQGRVDEALAGYEAALELDSAHEAARQALVVLLLQNNHNADAEHVLQDGLKLNIKNSGFAMLLARIQVDRDASWSALLTLQKTLPYAERQADYQAFVGALLQRLNRHKEAVIHYKAAVQLSPNSGVWWMGLGISQQALERNDDARDAFKHALDTHTLSADLQAYVSQQLKRL
jgi:MSHA biogenesis protein MshN